MITPTDKKPTLGLDLTVFEANFLKGLEKDAEELASTPARYAPDSAVLVEPIDPGDEVEDVPQEK